MAVAAVNASSRSPGSSICRSLLAACPHTPAKQSACNSCSTESALDCFSLAPLRAVIANERRALDVSGQRAATALARLMQFRRQRFETAAKLVDSLSYKSALRRGFVLVRDDKGHPVFAAASVKSWQPLTLEFADGKVTVREDSAKQGRLL